MAAKKFEVILHLQESNENGTQRDHLTSYLAANLEQVGEMIEHDYGSYLLYWEQA